MMVSLVMRMEIKKFNKKYKVNKYMTIHSKETPLVVPNYKKFLSEDPLADSDSSDSDYFYDEESSSDESTSSEEENKKKKINVLKTININK